MLVGEAQLSSTVSLGLCLPSGHVLDRLFLGETDLRNLVACLQQGQNTTIEKDGVALQFIVEGVFVHIKADVYSILRDDQFSRADIISFIAALLSDLRTN